MPGESPESTAERSIKRRSFDGQVLGGSPRSKKSRAGQERQIESEDTSEHVQAAEDEVGEEEGLELGFSAEQPRIASIPFSPRLKSGAVDIYGHKSALPSSRDRTRSLTTYRVPHSSDTTSLSHSLPESALPSFGSRSALTAVQEHSIGDMRIARLGHGILDHQRETEGDPTGLPIPKTRLDGPHPLRQIPFGLNATRDHAMDHQNRYEHQPTSGPRRIPSLDSILSRASSVTTVFSAASTGVTSISSRTPDDGIKQFFPSHYRTSRGKLSSRLRTSNHTRP